VEHVSRIIGRVRLRDLRVAHVERLRDRLLSEGRLAPQTVGDVLRVLSQALARAEAQGLVASNRADARLVHRPTGEVREFTLIDAGLAERILTGVRGEDPWDVAVNLALGLGLRREEVLGLRWGDISLADDGSGGTLEVRRTLTYADGQLHFGPPKSKAGRRSVALPAFVTRALRRHKAAQAERLLAIGLRSDDETLVVDDGIGNPWLPASFSTGWRRFSKAHGFDGVTFHGLRHGAATLLLAAGVPDAVAIALMGHADTAILRRYQDVVSDLRRDAAARMDALLGSS
jgi:integrase